MARRSLRTFLRLFDVIDVDADQEGPDVSQDVQLVYIADDIRRTADLDLGARAAEAAVVGEHAILSLAVQTRRGVEIRQAQGLESAAIGNDHLLFVWVSQVQPTITGAAVVVTPLRTGFLLPESGLTTGTIATAAIPATAFAIVNDQDLREFFITGPSDIGVVQHVNIAFGTANIATIMSLLWRELRLFP